MNIHSSHEMVEKSGKGLECVNCGLCTCHSPDSIELICADFFLNHTPGVLPDLVRTSKQL